MVASGMVASATEIVAFMFTCELALQGLVPTRRMAISMAVNERAILSKPLRGLARPFHVGDLGGAIEAEVNDFAAVAYLTIAQERLP